MSEKKQLIDDLLQQAQKQGMSDAETYITDDEQFEVRIHKGEIDGYSSSIGEGMGFRGIYNGKMGYSYTEKVTPDSLDLLIRHAIENASIQGEEDLDPIYEGSKEYKSVISYNNEFERISESQKIDFAKKMEDMAMKMDKRISFCQYCVMGSDSSKIQLDNSKQLHLKDQANHGFAYIMVLAQDGENRSSGLDYILSNDFNDYDAELIAKSAVEKAVAFLDAKSIKSKEYPVILSNETMAGLLSSISGIFSARAVQKNLSLLKNKLQEKIASDCISIIDDPFMKKATGSKSFDGEGVSTKYKRVIDKGILTTYLHNLKSAKKDDVSSTGNASRGSYKGNIGISPTNMYIEKGTKSLSSLFNEMNNGVYITDLDGMHAGLNTISGDFSLSAKGFLIEDGTKTTPINQITLSGNIYDLFKNAVAVADDFKLNMGGNIGSPAVYISGLSVAGE